MLYVRTGGTCTDLPELSRFYGPDVHVMWHAELHYIQGNRLPYFAVGGEVSTAESRRRIRRDDQIIARGCVHDEVLAAAPEVAPLIALHLADSDGVPMHAAANALFWAGGIINLGQRYHGGSEPDAKSCEDCVRILAGHLRITEDDARALAVAAAHHCPQEWRDEYGARLAAQYIADYCEAQRPRWLAEADAAIAWMLERAPSDLRPEYTKRCAELRAQTVNA